jgi:hypothetical protein
METIYCASFSMFEKYSFNIIVHNCLLGIYHGKNSSWLSVGQLAKFRALMALKYLGKRKEKKQLAILNCNINMECGYANLCGLVSLNLNSIPFPLSFWIRK